MPAGGGSASPVLGDSKPVRRFFAPCFLPDGLRLMYGALWLNGSNAYVEVPSVASLNPGVGNVSIDAWVKIDALADVNDVRVLVEKRADNPWRGYSFFLYNGRLGVQLADGTASNFISTIVVPADKAWHLVAVTVERANVQSVRFYRWASR